MAATRDHYDVIVIGSGPGGASLAHRLAGTGKRILMLERGDYLPRSQGQLGFQGGVRRCRLSGAGDLVRPRRRSVSSRPALFRRRQLQGLRRRPVPPARTRLRRAAAQGRGLSGLAAGLRRVRAVLHAGRGALSRARPARRGPDRTLVQRALRLSAGQARAAHPGPERHPGSARGCTRSICRSASSWTRTRTAAPPPTAPASAATRSTAFRARSTPRPTPR